MKTLEIAVDCENRNVYFAPIDRIIRGTFDFNRCREPLLRNRSHQFPQPIPGQRLRLDVEAKRAEIVEPLHDPAHKVLREQIEKRGMQLAREVETFEDVHVDTFLHFMKQACDAGHAQLTAGEFPEKIGKPKSLFTQPPEDPRDKTIERLTAIMYATLTPEQKKQAAEFMDQG